ncbi:hypothetical protein BGZ83_010737 [Gryganskiella cystojenkinii]|nr:hypothetical protein BGZ83_010737 [Gryganskiella cystojenkinii]
MVSAIKLSSLLGQERVRVQEATRQVQEQVAVLETEIRNQTEWIADFKREKTLMEDEYKDQIRVLDLRKRLEQTRANNLETIRRMLENTRV